MMAPCQRSGPIRRWRILEEESQMKRTSRQKPSEESVLGEKLLRSAQQARDWVQGKPVRVRVTYVPAPHVDVRKLRARMGLSQTQFEIGRASCREKSVDLGGRRIIKKKIDRTR